VAAFTTKRSALEANIKTQKQEVPTTGGSGPTATAAGDSPGSAREALADLVNVTKRRSAAVKALTNAGERIEDQKQLAETYKKWIDVISAKQRSVIHRGLLGAGLCSLTDEFGITRIEFLLEVIFARQSVCCAPNRPRTEPLCRGFAVVHHLLAGVQHGAGVAGSSAAKAKQTSLRGIRSGRTASAPEHQSSSPGTPKYFDNLLCPLKS
jgi:hypothetical protein